MLHRRKEHGDESDDKAGTETDKDEHAMIYYHKVGTPQSADILVLKDDANPEYMFGVSGTEE